MANTVTNVSTGKPKIGGAIYRAARTDNLVIPTTAAAELSTDYKCLGYVSEDGLKNNMTTDSDKVKAWGGDTVLAYQKGKEDVFTFSLLEVLNDDVLKTVFGDSNVTITAATSSAPKSVAVAVNNTELVESVWVIDMIMRGNNPRRIVIPYGKVTDIGEITYKDDDVVKYDVSLQAMPDTAGNSHYEYTNVGTATA